MSNPRWVDEWIVKKLEQRLEQNARLLEEELARHKKPGERAARLLERHAHLLSEIEWEAKSE